jgi:uncharacterized metal-binding protein YceD (DUF177 family)
MSSAPVIRIAALPAKKPHRFDLVADAALAATVAGDLGLLAIRHLRLKGELAPFGRRDWRLDARLTADVDQPCVVTLAPVAARIDDAVTRRYLADWQPPEGDEVEMPDDSDEPLPDVIDLAAVMAEALALALPPYPRAAGAELAETVVGPADAAPLTQDEIRPFAALKSLKDRMDGG